MIVLGKNKVDERYNILEDGTIVDLNGNVQELSIYRGRSHFKSIAVHKIQMWTNYGYRDTKIWDIHHLDKNPLNNSLSNLVYLTKNEHISLHMKRKHLSEETRKKISEHNARWFKGKHLSEETKQKMSKSQKGKNTWTKGKHWFNDGIKNYFCEQCPPGCVKGRLF